MLRDSKGFMWFTSHDGINRFDGTNCLSNEQIGPGFEGGQQTKGLSEDEKGNIWIGTGSSIFTFSYQTGQFQKFVPVILEPEKQSRNNSFLMPGPFSGNWMLVYRDNAPTFLFNTLTKETKVIPHAFKQPGGEIERKKLPGISALIPGLHSLLNDSLKVSVARVEQDAAGDFYWKDYIIFKKKDHPEWHGAEIYVLRDSIVVVGGEFGDLLKYNFSTRQMEVLPKTISAYPATLYIDENFLLWVGDHKKGVFVYDLHTNLLITHLKNDVNNDASLSKHRVQTILRAKDNTIWLSIWGKGVDYAPLTDNGFSHHLTPSDAKRFGINNFVRGIVQAKDGTFYANTQFGGIIQLDKNLNFLKTISQEVSASIYIDPKKENIYFGQSVLYCYNLKNKSITPILKKQKDYNPSFPIGDVYQFSYFEGDKILAAGVMGLEVIHPIQNIISQLPGALEIFNQQPIYAKQAKNGNIYINTSTQGLLIFGWNSNRYEKIFTFPEKFVTKHIWEENDTTHWIGTSKGLYVFNPVTRRIKMHYSSKNGLPNNVVYALAPDSMGRVWVSTNKGLASLEKASGKWTTYKNFSGTQGNEYNSHTVVTASDGRIIFGGVTGLTAIRPWEVDTDYPFPLVQITSIKGDSSYNPFSIGSGKTGQVSVVAGDNTLEFEFIGIDYNDPSACKLRFRLWGADENWVVSNNPGKARYVKLAPGTYTFEVMAANAKGEWSHEIRSVIIKIAPFWWQKKWLQVLAVIVLIAGVVILARMQVKRALFKKQVLLEKELSIIRERERITADLHDDVGATLSSLNIFGDIAHSIWEENPEKSKEMVGKIAGQSRELMFRMSDIIWSMKPEGNGNNGLTPRIRNFAQELLSGKGIMFDLVVDENIMGAITNPMARKNIILIIKEALNNVAKYSDAKKVTILLEKRTEILHIEIIDDGKGFETGIENQGNGLENMATRCRQMSGKFKITSKKGAGTTVACSIPIAIISYKGNE